MAILTTASGRFQGAAAPRVEGGKRKRFEVPGDTPMPVRPEPAPAHDLMGRWEGRFVPLNAEVRVEDSAWGGGRAGRRQAARTTEPLALVDEGLL